MRQLWLSWICFLSISLSELVSATAVTIKPADLVLNGELSVVTDDIADSPMVLILHGTLAHKGMEIVATMQQLLTDEAINSLAINLSLGLNDRQGFYDCKINHVHKHENAILELGYWVDWLKQQGVTQVLTVGHSRGASQVAAYNRSGDAVVKGQFLIAPITWHHDGLAKAYQQRYKVSLADKLAEAYNLPADSWMPKHTNFLYCTQGGLVSAGSFLSYYDPDQTLHTPELLQGQHLPTIVVAGSVDEVVTDLPQQMALYNLPQVKFEIIEDADHFFRDLYADELLEHLLIQLEEVMD
jgi:pimeloyl-ACP methyl ester carboxylesterase